MRLNEGMRARPYLILILGGLLARFLAVGISGGHPTDMATFYAWAEMLVRNGFRAFYTLPAFTDYPPGYMYILALLGHLTEFLGLSHGGFAHSVLFKTPAILADVAAGVLLFHIAGAHVRKNQRPIALSPLAVASLYVFNPLVIMLSAVWGQVDSIYALLLLGSLYLLTQKKDAAAYLIYAVAIMIKPQALMLAPVYLICAISRIKESPAKGAAFAALLGRGIMAAALMVLLSLPFGLADVLDLFVTSLASYPFVAVNAYNFYTLLGLNWAPVTDRFLWFSFDTWGMAAMGAAAVIGAALLWRKRDHWNVFYVSALICIIVFTFATRMHERYNFLIFIMLPAAYALRGSRKILFALAALTLAAFLNYVDALRLALANWDYSLIQYTSRAFSAVWMLAFLVFLIAAVKEYLDQEIKDFKPSAPPAVAQLPDDKPNKLGRIDYVGMIALTVVYTALAFFRLGDMHAPENPWTPDFGDEAVFDLGDHVYGAEMLLFNGARDNRPFDICLSADGVVFEPLDWHFNTGDVFSWNIYPLFTEQTFRYVRLTARVSDMRIMEIWFRGFEGEIIWHDIVAPPGVDIERVDIPAANLMFTDADRRPPERATFMNSTYFDEIFHPRTAYEFIHGLEVFEITHPPLGKVIISWGIRIFGMNPFGWRFMGTLVGVLMVPIIYIFAHKLFKSGFAAFITATLFTFDFMHFVQTRLATIDSYLVLFIILQYYFMYKFFVLDFLRTPLYKILTPLFFSGLFMGMGFATKWSGAYAGLGLAILFAIAFIRRRREHGLARKEKRPGHDELGLKTTIVILCSVVFFVIIPVIIYVLSYIPQYPGRGFTDFLAEVWDNQLLMFNYHGFLDADHPYASPWWSWPIMLLPIWYYANATAEGLRAGISAFGNPLVWWGGLVALFYTLYRFVKTRDKIALFLIIGYLAQFLPWMYVTRIVFIYHYFTAVPFLALMLGYVLYCFKNTNYAKTSRWIGIGFAVLAVAVFVLFYPVLSGLPVNFDFVDNALRWLPRWVLV